MNTEWNFLCNGRLFPRTHTKVPTRPMFSWKMLKGGSFAMGGSGAVSRLIQNSTMKMIFTAVCCPSAVTQSLLPRSQIKLKHPPWRHFDIPHTRVHNWHQPAGTETLNSVYPNWKTLFFSDICFLCQHTSILVKRQSPGHSQVSLLDRPASMSTSTLLSRLARESVTQTDYVTREFWTAEECQHR